MQRGAGSRPHHHEVQEPNNPEIVHAPHYVRGEKGYGLNYYPQHNQQHQQNRPQAHFKTFPSNYHEAHGPVYTKEQKPVNSQRSSSRTRRLWLACFCVATFLGLAIFFSNFGVVFCEKPDEEAIEEEFGLPTPVVGPDGKSFVKPKLAFCILTRGDLSQGELWKSFFAEAEDPSLFTIVVHNKTLLQDPYFATRTVPAKMNVDTKWGHVSIVKAELSVSLLKWNWLLKTEMSGGGVCVGGGVFEKLS